MFKTGSVGHRLGGQTLFKQACAIVTVLVVAAALFGISLTNVPVLCAQEVGQTPKPKDTTPIEERPEEEQVLLDKELDYFQFIEDDGPLPNRANKLPDPKKDMAATKELKAYEYILAKSAKTDPELLAKYASRNIPYPNLFKDIRRDYLRELIHIEGRLSLILAMKPTDDLKNFDKIQNLYEAWIYPHGHTNPLCLVVSELPPGVEPGDNLNLHVKFDAYLFKLFHYESRKDKVGQDGKKQWMKAPIFLGKTFTNLGPPPTREVYSDHMLLTLLTAVGGLTLLIAGLGWWLKRGGSYLAEEKQRRLEQANLYTNED